MIGISGQMGLSENMVQHPMVQMIILRSANSSDKKNSGIPSANSSANSHGIPVL